MTDFFALPKELQEVVRSKFDMHTKRGEKNQCWMWTGPTYKGGYGQIGLYRKAAGIHFYASAHRLSWMLRYNVPMPQDLLACHTCDTPACVNPYHIRLSTAKENTRDMVVRGRWIGGRASKKQLPIEDRVAIVKECINGATLESLSKKYSLDTTTIGDWTRHPDMVARFGKIDLKHRMPPNLKKYWDKWRAERGK